MKNADNEELLFSSHRSMASKVLSSRTSIIIQCRSNSTNTMIFCNESSLLISNLRVGAHSLVFLCD